MDSPTPVIVIPPVQPTTPITNPAQQASKLPWILLVVVLLAIMGAGGIFLGKQIAVPAIVVPTPAPVTTMPTSTTDPMANWQTYTNTKLGFTLKYPPSLYFKEYDPGSGVTLAFEPLPNPPTQGAFFDSIRVVNQPSEAAGFDILQQATEGVNKTGLDIHTACGIEITKLKNLKVGAFDAVEFIYDGSNPPADCGRDLIGYEHTVLIRKSATDFIKITNGSMKSANTQQHDALFKQILSTFKFTP